MHRKLKYLCVLASLALVVPLVAFSHHSPNVDYDPFETVEMTGRVTDVDSANPHSVITIMGHEPGGSDSEWRIEALAAAMIMRGGLNRDSVSVGDTVSAAGFRGRRNKNAIFMRNFLLADGREWVATPAIEPLWTDNLVGAESVQAQSDPANGRQRIFKVWSLDETTLAPVGPPRPLWNDSYPLTEMATETQSNYWGSVDNPYVNCANGMPAIMDTPIPMEFVREGENIVLRFEELDVRRLILMGDADQFATPIKSAYGHSVGRWEGDSLVVQTVAINWSWFDQDGIPLTENVEILERFSPSEDGRFLNYTATVTDDAVFTEPVVLDRRWANIPGEAVQVYDCRWNESDL